MVANFWYSVYPGYGERSGGYGGGRAGYGGGLHQDYGYGGQGLMNIL